jgi:hypothetical protein
VVSRVVDAEKFMSHFSSDRSHMYNPMTKEWNAPPPPYPSIESRFHRCNSNLDSYINMYDGPKTEATSTSTTMNGVMTQAEDDNVYGKVYTLPMLQVKFLR